MSSYDDYYIQVLNNVNVVFYRYIAPVLYILGNISNLLCVIIFFKKPWRKNVCVFYFNICLLINICFINSTTFGSIPINGYNIKLQNSNVILCKLFFYTSYFFSNILPNVLILALIDCLLISSQNVDIRLYSSKRLAYFSISISTFFCSIFFLHVFIKINLQQFGPSLYIYYYDQSKFYLDFISYSTLVLSVITTAMMIILSIFSFQNVRRIRLIPRQQRQQQIRTMNKKDFQLLRCSFVYNIVYPIFSLVLVVSIICGTPRKYQKRTPLEQAIDNFVSNAGSFLHHIPYCASFFIFISVSKAFRNEMKRIIFKIIIGKEQRAIEEEDYRQINNERNNTKLNIGVDTIVLRA